MTYYQWTVSTPQHILGSGWAKTLLDANKMVGSCFVNTPAELFDLKIFEATVIVVLHEFEDE